MRDYALETTFDLKFTTRRFSTGVPFTLAGTPVVSAYVDNSLTQLTAGITLTVDFDGVTGLNNIRVVATAANGYAAGSNYALVLTAGTVDSVSVVGEVVGEFSLEAQSPLRPLTALRKLDVTAANKVQGVVLVDTLTTYTGNTPQTGDVFPLVSTEIADIKAKTDNLPIDPADQSLIIAATDAIVAAVAAVQADTDNLQTRLPAALVGGKIDASVGAVAAGAIDAAAIATGAIDADALATDAVNEIADGLLDRNMATGTDSGSTTVRTMRQALRFLRNKFSVVGTTLTVTKEDDVTTSWTGVVTTDAAATPITGNDPAGP